MTKPPMMTFQMYRYQILPISQHVQMDLDGKIKNIEDLKAHKNAFFSDALRSLEIFVYSKTQLIHEIIFKDSDLTVLRIGIERDLERQRRDFTTETIEHWPSTLVIFDNRMSVQKCLIQKKGGFQNTQTVAKVLEKNINEKLKTKQLVSDFEPIYSINVFWDLVKEYEGRLTQIEFELISPNMSNLSKSLTLDLAGLNKSTNTHRTKLQLNSNPTSTLTPDKSDITVAGLVNYAASGGGDITLRARGIKRKMHTAKGISEISIDEIELKSDDPSALARSFRKLVGE